MPGRCRERVRDALPERRARLARPGRGRVVVEGAASVRGRRQGKGRARTKEVDEARAKRMALRRRYKIQDVIQRRQVLLVQVVKEERGNKGAALTTYLSLAGRYTVLMPNSSHGGGISRKISSASDRKRLKQVVSDLSLPRTMGLLGSKQWHMGNAHSRSPLPQTAHGPPQRLAHRNCMQPGF